MSIQTYSVKVFHDGHHWHVNLVLPDGTYLTTGPLEVPHGDHTLVHREIAPKTRRQTPKQKRRAAIRQEDDLARQLGGRRQPGSGALPGIKGDVKVAGKYRVEAKYTRNKTYRLDRTELGKIRGECAGLEVPLFVVDFVDPDTGGSPDRWVTLPFSDFQRMEYKPPYATGEHRGPP